MRTSVQHLLDRYYPVADSGIRHLDGTRPFYDWILENVDVGAEVLDIGAGPTPPPYRCLRGRVKRLVGVDIDSVVLANTCLDEARLNDGVHQPFPDGRFDAAYSDWTVEHVRDPLPFLIEIRRVLKPGAPLLFRTTNRHHYMTVVAARTPHWFHSLVANRVRALPMGVHDPWRTYYRMNTPASIRTRFAQAGFQEIEVRLLESYPSYLAFHSLAFRLGVAYERLVNWHPALSGFRLIILAKARRPRESVLGSPHDLLAGALHH